MVIHKRDPLLQMKSICFKKTESGQLQTSVRIVRACVLFVHEHYMTDFIDLKHGKQYRYATFSVT